MVTISLIFLLGALISLIRGLYASHEVVFLSAGIACLALLILSAAIYYTGYGISVLPWAQRVTFALLALWLVGLDFRIPRTALRNSC
jgi:hypothetical protein